MHFTENKSQQNLSVPKTPFSIEDILYQNANAEKLQMPKNGSNNHISAVQQINENSVVVNNNSGNKVVRNTSETTSNEEEYRKMLQNERFVGNKTRVFFYREYFR